MSSVSLTPTQQAILTRRTKGERIEWFVDATGEDLDDIRPFLDRLAARPARTTASRAGWRTSRAW